MTECAEFKSFKILDLKPINILQREACRDAAENLFTKSNPIIIQVKAKASNPQGSLLGWSKALVKPSYRCLGSVLSRLKRK